MRVKSCVASDGSGHVINLSDEFGCVLRPKMISRFLKARAPDERATVITYAFFHAFKFPDALSVHIKCKVEICRHGCLDHCQNTGVGGGGGGSGESLGLGLGLGLTNANERKDVHMSDALGSSSNDLLRDLALPPGGQHGMGMGMGPDHDIFYEDIIHDHKQTLGGGGMPAGGDYGHEKSVNLQPRPVHEEQEEADLSDLFGDEDLADLDMEGGEGERYLGLKKSGKFPHGPRQLEAQKRMGVPMAGPRSLEPHGHGDEDVPRPVYRPQAEALKQPREDHIDLDKEEEEEKEKEEKTQQEDKLTGEGGAAASNDSSKSRRRRSLVISDRKVRSADVGVSGLYDVISEADLAFSPDSKQEAVTVFQGKISEEVVYGICMPVPGFSILFIVVISATIVSALVAGSLLYRYQLQKEALEKQTPMPVTGTLASWMTLRLFRLRHMQQQQQQRGPGPDKAQQSAPQTAAAATLQQQQRRSSSSNNSSSSNTKAAATSAGQQQRQQRQQQHQQSSKSSSSNSSSSNNTVALWWQLKISSSSSSTAAAAAAK